MQSLIPLPVSIRPASGVFTLAAGAAICIQPDTPELQQLGRYLSGLLSPATGFPLPMQTRPQPGSITLTLQTDNPSLGEEGYHLTIQPDSVNLGANQPAGLFYGLQTLRQLLPLTIEAATPQPGPWSLPALEIVDYPRYAWRGAMLDVARHFFSVADVKHYIDELALFKLNRLHLHLTDDQGWRIQIHSWPRLTEISGPSAVDGDPGGFYTQTEYANIVEYARQRSITIVPEIDLPGHTNAALAAYAELNADETARPVYTGTEVGFSSLCARQEVTYRFVDDVIRELAAITPGLYIHIGGDESLSTSEEDYHLFIGRVQQIVQAHGKIMVGWEEIGKTHLLPTTIAQPWKSYTLPNAGNKHLKVILSPASKTYLDMQYDPSTPLGLHWAGYMEVKDAYDWDPLTIIQGVAVEDVLGIEAPLWSETLRTLSDIEFMVFPRLAGLAELAWSPATDWQGYRQRLEAFCPRLDALGIHYYHSPQIKQS